jgi:hypothetical protein
MSMNAFAQIMTALDHIDNEKKERGSGGGL